jgi:hypothetical protein
METKIKQKTKDVKTLEEENMNCAIIEGLDCYKLYLFIGVIARYTDEVEFRFTKTHLVCDFMDPSRIMVGVFKIKLSRRVGKEEFSIILSINTLRDALSARKEDKFQARLFFYKAHDKILIFKENEALEIKTSMKEIEDDPGFETTNYERFRTAEYSAKVRMHFKYLCDQLRQCSSDVIEMEVNQQFGFSIYDRHYEFDRETKAKVIPEMLIICRSDDKVACSFSNKYLGYLKELSMGVKGAVELKLKEAHPLSLELKCEGLPITFEIFLAPRVKEEYDID